MNHLILPFTTDVEMKAYQNKAFPLGAIKATLKDYDTWLCNVLIDCAYYTSGLLDSYNYIWNIKDDLIISESLNLRSGILDNSAELITLNKNKISEGMYVHGTYNAFYIKGKSAYQRHDFNHDYIIFGYDDDKRVFKSAAYLADRNYRMFDIDYDSYYNGVVNNKIESTYLYYRKINTSYTPKINIDHVKTNMLYYVNSSREIPNDSILCFGLHAWDKFKDYVINSEDPTLDCRYSRVFMEHRTIMKKRLKRLWELGYLPSDFSDEYSINVCSPAQITHHLFIKYNLTQNPDIRSKIVQTIQRANNNEADILNNVVNKYF